MKVWLDDYEELMFGTGHTPQTMEAGAELKRNNMPRLLYKYRPISTYSLEALEGDFLYSSQPDNFNDPFEGPIEISSQDAKVIIYQKAYAQLRIQRPFLPDRQVKSYNDLIENLAIGYGGSYDDVAHNCKDFCLMKRLGEIADINADETINALKKCARNMYNICCFSAENDNELMWAHYTDEHSGFCVGYDIKGLNNAMTQLTFPVIYRQKCCFSINDLEDISGSLCMYALTIKSPSWSYEKEWRTFFLPNPPIHKEQMPTPKVVYLGVRINSADKDRIEVICKRKGILLYQMEQQLNGHKLITKAL